MKIWRPWLRYTLAFAIAAGCGSPEPVSEATEEPVTATPPPAQARQHSAGSLLGLRWLEGRWVGEEPNGTPFYEGYRFENDSTIRTYTYADSITRVPKDSGTIVQRDGEVTTGSANASWSASDLTANRVEFVPRAGVQNSFAWERVSADEWTATLRWPAVGDRPAREVVYRMRRLP